jgi:hypothetical protein
MAYTPLSQGAGRIAVRTIERPTTVTNVARPIVVTIDGKRIQLSMFDAVVLRNLLAGELYVAGVLSADGKVG